MINVKIDEDTALEMLSDRVRVWKSDAEAELFDKMYESYVYGGYFDNAEFDIMSIVDNDIVNYCSIISAGDKDFEKLLKLYKDDERDVSCEDFEDGNYSYIEAVSDDETMILIRW